MDYRVATAGLEDAYTHLYRQIKTQLMFHQRFSSNYYLPKLCMEVHTE